MQKIFNLVKKQSLLFLLIILVTPAFFRMLPKGIYSMQDFHLFRLYEFDQCVERFEIPCRWAMDAGLGYGEPLFNFYGQFVYLIGEVFHLIGFSLIDSVKILFILSLVGSAISMYFLANNIWKNKYAAILSSILYVYAPYRAVDVWVRGALPEAFSFILFPLIVLSLEKKNLFYFSLLLFLLIITHNLSFIMFLPFILFWIIYRKWWRGFAGIVVSGFLSAFYILPVIFESKYVDLELTTRGYFDFRAHFITLKQIFLDFSWGYGGSTWGTPDGLNLSVGLLQWIIPIAVLSILLFKKIKIKNAAYALITLGLIYLFLSHNRSTLIWELLPFMKYIQFPWRFLGMAVFCFSLSSGALLDLFNNKLFIVITFIFVSVYAVFCTFNYFKPDIWYSVSDQYFLTGEEWDRQRTASIKDYWPKFGHEIPNTPSDGKYINYFPGWKYNGEIKEGLILRDGAIFKNTPIRIIGNIVSLISLAALIVVKLSNYEIKRKISL